jgi:hypothetical protein
VPYSRAHRLERNPGEVDVKPLLLAVTTLSVVAALNLSPAMAQEPKPSGGNGWAGIRPPAASGSLTGMRPPHYEFQYGYDKHAAWRGHWVLLR